MKTAATAHFRQLYQQLNPEQRLAVDTIEGPVIVLAGPGTGKTQVLAMRVAKILQDTHMDPHNVLCLTFTESATIAMRRRLVDIIGQAGYHVRIHTFHSFCNTVIQDHPEKFAFARDLSVLTEIERVQLLRQIIDELPGDSRLKPFGNPYLYVNDISKAIQTLKQEHISPERYEQLLADTTTITKALTPLLTPFFDLKLSERTGQRCQTLQQAMQKITTNSTLIRFFDDYDEQVLVAESEREMSSLRTKLKNNLKQWWMALHKYLPLQRGVGAIYATYQQRLRERGRYDYEDMIAFVIDAWRHDDALLAYYQEQLQYILIDEYQDTNSAQNELVHLLGSWHQSPNIFVVGDDQQSIYRFQGASLENLLQFYGWYRRSVRLITLQANYRSPQHILDAAFGVISHGDDAIPADVTSERKALVAQPTKTNVPIIIRSTPSEAAEDYRVAQQIKQLINQGVSPNEIAVLYRYHRDAEGLIQMMGAQQVPFRLEGGQDIFAERRIQQVVHLLRTIRSIDRDDLLARLLHFDWLGLPPLDSLKVTHFASRQRLSLLTVLSTLEHLTAAGVSQPHVFLELVQKIAQWRTASEQYALQHTVAMVIQESGLLRSILATPEALTVLGHLNTLFSEIQAFNRAQPDATIDHFLEYLAVLKENGLKIEAQPLLSRQAAVRLMTAHRAKGLEFEHVFVIHLTDGHWGNVAGRERLPLPAGLLQHERGAMSHQNEDERRLFYVAMTRAKQQLYLSYARTNTNGREQLPSIFLAEIPPTYCTVESDDDTAEEAIARLKSLVVTPPLRQGYEGQALKDWVQGVLDRYVMSVTHLNHYLECPRLFYYTHILRVPTPTTKHMAYGTAVHAALWDLFIALQAGETVSAEYVAERFTHHLQHQVLTESERRDTLALGQSALKHYFTHYHTQFSPSALVEYDFHSHGVQLDGLRLTGKLDKIEIVDPTKKIVNVVDYKTGNPDSKSRALGPEGMYRRQLIFYKLLGDLSPRFPYTITSGEIDFIQPSVRTSTFVKRHFDLTDDDTMRLVETIRATWQEIKDLAFLDPANPKFCGQCEYCTITV